jgi:hypothetical protein
MSRKKSHMGNIFLRLQELVNDFAGGNKAEFSRITGIPQSSFHNYATGKRDPQIGHLNSIRDKLNINLNWLISGDEPKYLSKSSKEKYNIYTDTIAKPEFEYKKSNTQRIDKLESEMRDLQDEIKKCREDLKDIKDTLKVGIE